MDQEINHIEKYQLNILSELLYRFEDALHAKVDGKMIIDNDYPNILLQVAGKFSLTLRAIIKLCSAGLPDAALALARSLYEQSILLTFFETVKQHSDFTTYVEDYYLDYKYQVAKDNRWQAENIDNDRCKVKQYDDVIRDLRQKAHRNIQGEYWWTGQKSFYDVVLFIIRALPNSSMKHNMLIGHYFYKRACKEVHAGSLGNTLRLGSNRVCYGVDNTAKASGHGLPLYLAVRSFHMVTFIVFSNLSIVENGLLSDMDHLLNLYATIDSEDNNANS